jgi:hypothetical protein
MSVLPTVLPRLRGSWLWGFRLIWCAAFAIALFSTAGATWTDARDPATTSHGWPGLTARAYGIGIGPFAPVGSTPWRIGSVFSPDALAAGIRPSDQFVAINGRAVTRDTEVADLTLALPNHEGRRAILRLRAADGSTYERTLTYHAATPRIWYQGSGLSVASQFMARRIGYDLMAALLLGVSAILFLRRSHDIVSGAFALALVLIPIGPTVEFWAAIDALRAYHVLSAIPYILMLMVACAFPDGRFWPSWTRFSIILAPAVLLPAMAFAIEYTQFTLFTAPGFVAVIAILALRYRRLSPGVERQQFRSVAFGLGVGVIVLIARWPFGLFQISVGPGPLSPWIGLAGSFLHAIGYIIIGLGFGVSLLKYRLYDAESLISRSVALTAATLLIAGLWAALEKAIENLLPSIVGAQQQALAGVISAAVAVALVGGLHGRMQGWIEKRFYRGVYRLKEKLPQMLEALSARGDTTRLCEEVLGQVARDVRVTKAAILLGGEGDLRTAARLQSDEAEVRAWLDRRAATGADDGGGQPVFKVAVPLVDPLGEVTLGWLLVGPRPDGTTCNRDERAALAAAAEPIARAIAAVQARDEREGRLLAGVREGLKALEARLSNLERRGRAVAGPT